MAFTTPRFIASAFMVACAFASTTCTAVRVAFTRAVAFLRDIPEAFAHEPGFKAGAIPAEKHQACAYALKQAKRERPTIAPGMWRMCPSC